MSACPCVGQCDRYMDGLHLFPLYFLFSAPCGGSAITLFRIPARGIIRKSPTNEFRVRSCHYLRLGTVSPNLKLKTFRDLTQVCGAEPGAHSFCRVVGAECLGSREGYRLQGFRIQYCRVQVLSIDPRL